MREHAVQHVNESRVVNTSFSPDGARIITTSVDRTARLWNATTGRELNELYGHYKRVESASFSPDGDGEAGRNVRWERTA
jgi:WD40 repeat protein